EVPTAALGLVPVSGRSRGVLAAEAVLSWRGAEPVPLARERGQTPLPVVRYEMLVVNRKRVPDREQVLEQVDRHGVLPGVQLSRTEARTEGDERERPEQLIPGGHGQLFRIEPG